MKNALEKKLQKLQAQKESLDAKIRLIEKERAQELRQLRHKKYSLIGKVILTKLEAAETLNFTSESDLLALLDRQLISKSDRQTFGLPYPVYTEAQSASDNEITPEIVLSKSQKSVKAAPSGKAPTVAKKVTQDSITKTNLTPVLTSPYPQSELAKEFNL